MLDFVRKYFHQRNVLLLFKVVVVQIYARSPIPPVSRNSRHGESPSRGRAGCHRSACTSFLPDLWLTVRVPSDADEPMMIGGGPADSQFSILSSRRGQESEMPSKREQRDDNLTSAPRYSGATTVVRSRCSRCHPYQRLRSKTRDPKGRRVGVRATYSKWTVGRPCPLSVGVGTGRFSRGRVCHIPCPVGALSSPCVRRFGTTFRRRQSFSPLPTILAAE